MQDNRIINISEIFGVPRVNLLSESEFSCLIRAASPERKALAKRFFKKEDANRTIIAEALLRYIIKAKTGLELDNLTLIKNEYGKPAIPEIPFQFNISHSGEWVVCGISYREIGVDVEMHHDIDIKIAGSFFSREEAELLDRCNSRKDQLKLFFTIWSLKESYIKAIGKGLSCPLDSFACLPSQDGKQVSFHRYEECIPHRSFSLINIDPQYSCAVCCDQDVSITNLVLLSPELLLADQ